MHRCRIFDLNQVRFAAPDDRPDGEFYVIDAPDWINVIALDDDRRVLMLRQFRFGVNDVTLEIPGGMCDRGEPPIDAARRELREETGYEAAHWAEMGWVHPNPSIQHNRCHTYLATGLVRAGEPEPDEHEDFELVEVPLEDVPGLIASGAISHALVLAAFQLYGSRSTSSK